MCVYLHKPVDFDVLALGDEIKSLKLIIDSLKANLEDVNKELETSKLTPLEAVGEKYFIKKWAKVAKKAGTEMKEQNVILKKENIEMRAKLQTKVIKPNTEQKMNSNDTKELDGSITSLKQEGCMEPPQGRINKGIPRKNIYICQNCDFKAKDS